MHDCHAAPSQPCRDLKTSHSIESSLSRPNSHCPTDAALNQWSRLLERSVFERKLLQRCVHLAHLGPKSGHRRQEGAPPQALQPSLPAR